MAKPSLRRYTNLPSLVSVLQNKCLTLLSPKSWDDRNDSHFLEQYRKRKNVKGVVALCFCEAPETYHHWRIFAYGPSGICLELNRESIDEAVRAVPQVQLAPVQYRTLRQLRETAPKLEDLPFLKRYAFEPERELRLFAELEKENGPTLDLPIDIDSIRRVHLSPWLPRPLAKDLRKLVRSFDGCEHLEVSRTTLVENNEWKGFSGPDDEECGLTGA